MYLVPVEHLSTEAGGQDTAGTFGATASPPLGAGPS